MTGNRGAAAGPGRENQGATGNRGARPRHRLVQRPAQPREGTDSARLVAAIDNANPETTVELARRLQLRAGDAGSMLHVIAKRYGLVEQVDGRWRRDDAKWRPPVVVPAPPEGSRVHLHGPAAQRRAVRIAQPREIPDGLGVSVWKPPAVPRRPGADDYRHVPSRVGDVRIGYREREPVEAPGAGGGA